MIRRFLLVGLLLSGCVAAPRAITLSDAQQGLVGEVQAYLNGLRAFKARFVQSGAFGAGAGWVWVQRPGRLRITDFGPQGRDMVADRGVLVVLDHANGSRTTMPVARTPLNLLLADRIALSGAAAITGITQTEDTVTVTLKDTEHPAQGTLSVSLARGPWRLLGVVATDVRGRSLAMALTELDVHPVMTPGLFALPASPAPS